MLIINNSTGETCTYAVIGDGIGAVKMNNSEETVVEDAGKATYSAFGLGCGEKSTKNKKSTVKVFSPYGTSTLILAYFVNVCNNA